MENNVFYHLFINDMLRKTYAANLVWNWAYNHVMDTTTAGLLVPPLWSQRCFCKDAMRVRNQDRVLMLVELRSCRVMSSTLPAAWAMKPYCAEFISSKHFELTLANLLTDVDFSWNLSSPKSLNFKDELFERNEIITTAVSRKESLVVSWQSGAVLCNHSHDLLPVMK